MKTAVRFRNTWTGPEAYGSAGFFGNKYWVNVPPEATKEEVVNILLKSIPERKNEKVVFESVQLSAKPMEITFFIYSKPDPGTGKPKTAGDIAADLVYEWTEKDGLKEMEEG